MIAFDFWLFNLGWLATILFWIVAAIFLCLVVRWLNSSRYVRKLLSYLGEMATFFGNR